MLPEEGRKAQPARKRWESPMSMRITLRAAGIPRFFIPDRSRAGRGDAGGDGGTRLGEAAPERARTLVGRLGGA